MLKNALILMFLLSASYSQAGYPLGADVEDFTLNTPVGDPVSLLDFDGDVILVNFFATW